MPMDCDDNDISRHNFQLAGEGRTKSSALRPYDFPKFDFDDSLQGHLRFDSLVETEVFLGIQSQEDNRWIEDFSRGSNGMEFNSTPADSCSISRRNNVWSEATSSESVEMLLKSVGQEEMIPGASVISESNACDDQGALTKDIETGTKLDARDDANVATSDATLSQDEVLKDYPASRRHVEEQLPEVEDPVTHANVESACGNSGNLIQNAVCRKVEITTNEGKSSFHDELADENLEESRTSVEKTSIINNINSNVRMLSTSEASQQVNSNVAREGCNDGGEEKHVFAETKLEGTMILEGKTGETSINSHTVSSSLSLVPESGVVDSHDDVEASPDVDKEPNNLVKGESELKSSEGDGKNASVTASVQTLKHEKILAISREMNDPFDGCQGGSSTDVIDQHSAALGSFSAGRCASPEGKINPGSQLTCKRDKDEMNVVPASPSKCESMPETEMPFSSMDDKKVPTESGDYIGNTDVGKSSDMEVLSSAADYEQTENAESCHDGSMVTREEPGSHLPAHVMDDSRQVIEENYDNTLADVSEREQDISRTREADKKLPTDPENMDSENFRTLTTGPRTQSLDVGEGVKANDIVHELQPQTSGKMESANNVAPHAKTNVSAALHGHTEIERREPAMIRSSHSDNHREEAGGTMSSDVNFGTEVGSVSKVEVSVADITSRSPLSELTAKSMHSVKKNDDVSSSAPLSVEAIQYSYLGHPQVHLGCGKSSLKDSVNADLVGGQNHEVIIRKTEEVKESAQTADMDKASCGSPTIISSSEPSRVEKDNLEDAKGYEITGNFCKDIQSTSEDPKRKNALGDDSSFTFKVNALPDTTEREPGKSWSPFPSVEKCKSSMVVEVTSPSGKGKTKRTPSQKTPRQSAQVSDGEPVLGTSKGASERKGRRASTKGMAKENAKKGSQAKGTSQESASLKVEKVPNILLSTSSSSPHVQFGQMQQYGNVDASNKKLSGAAAVPASNIPDLNTSALNNSTSPSATFRQPFTDLQQVQLRAQIFVYGSLIQGSAPDEACMVSAFGSSDGGRSTWEPVWRVAVERARSQKSGTGTAETPVHSQSGSRATDSVKQSLHSSKVLATPASKASSKDNPATIGNPIIPLSSPLWSISTPRDNLPPSIMHKGPVADFQPAVTPVHSYQTPSIRNFVGHTSWPSQTCFPSPWLASPQIATFSSTVRFQPVTMTETVKLTPVKDTSGPVTSSMKHMTSTPAINIGGKTIASAEQHAVDSKPRKRKKVSASDSGQVSLLSEAQTEPVVISNVPTLLSSPVGVPAPACPASAAVLSKPAADASGVCSIDHSKKGDLDKEKADACSEVTLSKVAEAKSQAEDAADLATAAVSHCEALWSQLAKQRESGLTSIAEAKLASAAVAVAAAASVAKAAAAAAKIACNAALQAKLMADEAFLSSKTNAVIPSTGKSSTDVHDVGSATPASILKSNNITNQSSSILFAAKEAAKRRVEAASAASKQAENLDAIVKAAELAAAAVSQAGKIVAMGEPLPLNDLIEAGPEGYWKLPPPSELAEKSKDGNNEHCRAISLEGGANVPAKVSGVDSVKKGGLRVVGEIRQRERANDSLDGHMSLSDGIMGSMHTDQRNFRVGKDHKDPDTAKSTGVASEPTQETSNVQNEDDELMGTLAEDSIKEGSLVEVFKQGNGLKSAWYSANVLSLEGGKAYVCYSDLSSEEASGNLREWVPLESEGDKVPIVRAAHPLSTLQYQPTRKRRRAALGDYAWCVGDRVDVWIDDCWWEGVVTEKNEKDETTLKVHFPAQGETSIVRAWNLRTSRSWIDGKWVEWSSLRGLNSSELGDTPQEKRLKLGSPALATNVKDKLSNDVGMALKKPEESKSLTLSTSESTFNIGKMTKEDDKRAERRPLRTGQQKEGSRVIFGVPKPTGKKRKFMEVSKHFPANKGDKGNEANESVKFAKYLMPQGTAARGWKLPSRNESKEKRNVESKPRVPVTRKAHRTLPQRDNLKSKSAQDHGNSAGHGTDMDDSVSNNENASEKSINHSVDACEEAAEAPLSSLLSHSMGTFSKKTSSSNTKSDRLNRGKLVPSGGKLSTVEEDKVYSVSDITEPRRSNRRIQPTHRLLEGLQSSMVIPKMPSVSHDKGRRNAPAKGK